MRKKAHTKRLFGIFLLIIAPSLFFTSPVLALSSAELSALASLGERALEQGDLDQMFFFAQKILDADPKNLDGYKLVLIYMVQKHNETGFNKAIALAEKKGIPKEEIRWLAAEILYVGEQPEPAKYQLIEYEEAWYAARKLSRKS